MALKHFSMNATTSNNTSQVRSDLSYEEFIAHAEARAKQEMSELMNKMSGANVDLTLLSKPVFSSKTFTVFKKKFQVNVHTEDRACEAIGNIHKREIKCAVQVFNGDKSITLAFTQAQLDELCVDWEGKQHLKSDDYLNLAITAAALASPVTIFVHLFKEIAMDKPFNAVAIYRILD